MIMMNYPKNIECPECGKSMHFFKRWNEYHDKMMYYYRCWDRGGCRKTFTAEKLLTPPTRCFNCRDPLEKQQILCSKCGIEIPKLMIKL